MSEAGEHTCVEYRIRFHHEFTKDVDPLPKNLQKRIGKVIRERLQAAPDLYGDPLRGRLAGFWKIRTGNYRIVYELDASARLVIVWGVKHRKNVYQKMEERWQKRS